MRWGGAGRDRGVVPTYTAVVTATIDPPQLSAVPWHRRLLRRSVFPGLLCLGMLAWMSFPLTGLGGWSTRGIELFVFAPMGGLVLLVVSLPLLAFRATRMHAQVGLERAAVLLLLFLPCLRLGGAARMLAFEMAGERAAPLIDAIERHIAETGRVPARLQELVPRWLDRLPDRLPPLAIEGGAEFANPWILAASVPSGVLNWDQFFYFPNQDYPEHGFGGSWQRLGRWAYLHE